MKFTLPQLPYSYNSLEPHFDARTMEIHHTKHHQAYTDKLNDALSRHPELPEQSAEDLVGNISDLPADIQTAIRNYGGGYINHNFFWQILSPDSRTLTDRKLKQELVDKFGSYDRFVAEFSAQAISHFGSGWAWLVVDGDDQLQVITTANQDSSLTQGFIPILTLDLWEHAYYLKYQNRRPEYINAFWNVINWPAVAASYQQALQR